MSCGTGITVSYRLNTIAYLQKISVVQTTHFRVSCLTVAEQISISFQYKEGRKSNRAVTRLRCFLAFFKKGDIYDTYFLVYMFYKMNVFSLSEDSPWRCRKHDPQAYCCLEISRTFRMETNTEVGGVD